MKRTFGLILFLLSVTLTPSASTAVWDYDGDGKTDLFVYRRVNNDNHWYILKSRDGFFSTIFGRGEPNVYGDGPIPGDFDGDGKYDIAVARGYVETPYRYFIVLNSGNNTLTFVQWGLRSDDIMLQDYDADGKTDFGVYRGGWWYINNSSDGSFRAEKFGGGPLGRRDEPIHGDFDGDRKADLAVITWFPSSFPPMPITFHIKFSTNGTWSSFQMGDKMGDISVYGDFDGDGKTDMALWGGGEHGDNHWKWIRSSDGQFVSYKFGLHEHDYAVPGDFDGDGKTDYAVYRRNASNQQNYFYIQRSRDGFQSTQWGQWGVDSEPMRWFNK
ncbi:MAG TPA: VCBS repeat-containing protein [Pyrinomonadaceae bacterium]|nr:VCBS repeat-containing protein [Pyrinomonadaceae bacterium]